MLEAENVCSHPEIGNGCVPGAGYRAQGREEELVYRAGEGVEDEEGDKDKDDVAGYPREGERGEWFHSDERAAGDEGKGGQVDQLLYASPRRCDKNIS